LGVAADVVKGPAERSFVKAEVGGGLGQFVG
jgi:hypothetical protein